MENEGHIMDRTIQNSTNFKGQDYFTFCCAPYKINCVYLLHLSLARPPFKVALLASAAPRETNVQRWVSPTSGRGRAAAGSAARRRRLDSPAAVCGHGRQAAVCVRAPVPRLTRKKGSQRRRRCDWSDDPQIIIAMKK